MSSIQNKQEFTKYFMVLDIKINDKSIKFFNIHDRRIIRNLLIKRYKIGSRLSKERVEYCKEKFAEPLSETIKSREIFNIINREEFFKFDHKRYLNFKRTYYNVKYDKENSTPEGIKLISEGEFKMKIDISLKEPKEQKVDKNDKNDKNDKEEKKTEEFKPKRRTQKKSEK